MRITLPYPPSVNRYWRHVVLGKRSATLLSKEAREYKVLVAQKCAALDLQPAQGDVLVCIDAYRPRKVGDLDGVLKGALDALQGFAYKNDSQVVGICARRFDSKEFPRIVVWIEPATEAAMRPDDLG